MEDFFNNDPDDGFNPEDHGIENDEIAKIHAMADMKEDHAKWARTQALKFYADFEHLDIQTSIKAVNELIKMKEVKKGDAITMLNHMIAIFEETEEYEKCNVCNQIKEGIK
jgi:hypothetical protein